MTARCASCGGPVTIRETASAWIGSCAKCQRIHCKTKDKVGGTRGAGAKDDGRSGVVR